MTKTDLHKALMKAETLTETVLLMLIGMPYTSVIVALILLAAFVLGAVIF